MSKYEVIVEAAAEEDLYNIFDYISNSLFETETAKNLIEAISGAFESLEQFPLRTPIILRERYKDINLRRLIVKNYSVIYFADEKKHRVHIISVINNRRDIEYLFDEL